MVPLYTYLLMGALLVIVSSLDDLVKPENELELIQFLQSKGFDITINNTQQILTYNQYLDNQGPRFFQLRKPFETALQDLKNQDICYNNLEQFRLNNFNAIGKIRVTLQDGTEYFCAGTMVTEDGVLTTAECFQQNAIFKYQRSWQKDWLPFRAVYVPDEYFINGTSNFALFYLREAIECPPLIKYELAVPSLRTCYLTLLGFNTSSEEQEYNMVTCPNLPDKQKLGVSSKNCANISCNVEDTNFATGSPIVLTCQNPVESTVIGMLSAVKVENSKTKISSEIVFPYMFTYDRFTDVANEIANIRL